MLQRKKVGKVTHSHIQYLTNSPLLNSNCTFQSYFYMERLVFAAWDYSWEDAGYDPLRNPESLHSTVFLCHQGATAGDFPRLLLFLLCSFCSRPLIYKTLLCASCPLVGDRRVPLRCGQACRGVRLWRGASVLPRHMSRENHWNVHMLCLLWSRWPLTLYLMTHAENVVFLQYTYFKLKVTGTTAAIRDEGRCGIMNMQHVFLFC